jgi:hypothetical protein
LQDLAAFKRDRGGKECTIFLGSERHGSA